MGCPPPKVGTAEAWAPCPREPWLCPSTHKHTLTLLKVWLLGGDSAAKGFCLPLNLTPDSPRCCNPKRLFTGPDTLSSN